MTDTVCDPPTVAPGVDAPNGPAFMPWNERMETACRQACEAIAPAWPLDRAIAVNPHWARVGMPVRRVAARMGVLGGMSVLPPRELLREAWAEGRLGRDDVEQALDQVAAARPAGWNFSCCVAALNTPLQLPQLPLLIDVLDSDPDRAQRLSWRQAITHQVSQTCAAYFDEHQADWRPERTQGLYTFWRETLQRDHGIGLLMGLPRLDQTLGALPASRQDAEHWVLSRLGLPATVWADYLEAVLLTVNGWASWCAYLAWQAGQLGAEDGHLRDLLAIRLAWGAVLQEGSSGPRTARAFAALQAAWAEAPQRLAQAEDTLLVDEVWQVALERGYQRTLAQRLLSASPKVGPATVEVQAAFCIDVRSEPLRRAIEVESGAVQTLGFAGFFGLPVAYTPLATDARRPQLPGLLAPAMEVQDVMDPAPGADAERVQAQAGQARQQRLALGERWRAFSRWPGAAFSFVESAGLAYLGPLTQWLRPGAQARARDDLHGLPARYRSVCRPQLAGVDTAQRVALAARVLHAMGLERDLAPLVLLVGHGSQSANNAHAAALDCGACCGQTGEVNARSLAQLLNDPAVRAGLREQGTLVPEATWFVAALHNTTTDEIEGFDLDTLPPTARAHWERLQPVLARAGDRVRRERAPLLGLDPAVPAESLLATLRRRANDGAQTRPEWGLAGNAAFVIAPRSRTLGTDLRGRSFLHDYDASQDADGSVLELLMTAPMLVTHWINWQYHSSTCDPLHLGSGNKVLHNVVGGTLGVFEGNAGDLRIGLAKQSLHDGTRWVHEPLRLTVVIDAPQDAIDTVIARHAVVQQLLDNGWLHLWRFSERGLARHVPGGWMDLDTGR